MVYGMSPVLSPATQWRTQPIGFAPSGVVFRKESTARWCATRQHDDNLPSVVERSDDNGVTWITTWATAASPTEKGD